MTELGEMSAITNTMGGSKRIETFTDRYPLVGPVFWIVSLQFFLIQFWVATAWLTPYSLAHNTISDLGASVCGNLGGRSVCSPLHVLMNTSFIILGLSMIIGSVLIYHEFRRTPATAWAFGLMALGGLGTLLVGLFPENTNMAVHALGAFLPFFFGNIALLIFGYALDIPPLFRLYTIMSGALSLAAFLLFVSHTYLGLGEGGMERLVAHPQTIWLIVFGLYMTGNHYRSRKSAA